MLALLIPGVGLGGGTASAPIFAGTIPDITQTFNTGNYTYELGTYFTLATSYAIAPAVETGWTFNTSTAQLVIDTDALGTFGPYTVTATNAAGSTPSNAFAVNVVPAAVTVVSTDQPSGGWSFWVQYEQETERRRCKKQEQEELEQATEQIPDAVDRDIARFLRDQEAKDERRAELERLREIARAHAQELKGYDERVDVALARALEKATYSSAEALERELERARTEEEVSAAILYFLMEDQD